MSIGKRIGAFISGISRPGTTATGPRPPPVPASTYAPERDGEPDPGEVVWAWVPYEDDPSRARTGPCLVPRRRRGRLGRA